LSLLHHYNATPTRQFVNDLLNLINHTIVNSSIRVIEETIPRKIGLNISFILMTWTKTYFKTIAWNPTVQQQLIILYIPRLLEMTKCFNFSRWRRAIFNLMRNSFNDLKFVLFKCTTLIIMSETKVIASNVKAKFKLQLSKTVLLSELILNLNLFFAVQSSLIALIWTLETSTRFFVHNLCQQCYQWHHLDLCNQRTFSLPSLTKVLYSSMSKVCQK